MLPLPKYHSLRQVGLNDCWFLSALVGMAYQRAEKLRDMVTDHGGGTYEVKFPEHDALVVTVTEPVEGTTSEPWPWGRVFEVAAGKVMDIAGSRVFTYGEGIGLLTGKSRTGRTNLTGMGFAPIHVWNKRKWFQELLEEQAGRRLMVLGGTDGTYTKAAFDWISPQHCYALINYDRGADRVRLRDPRGDDPNVEGRKDAGYGPGEFWLTAAETEDCFNGLTVEDE